MSGRGWFRAYRKLFDPRHDLAGDVVCRRWAWLDLVGMATHEPTSRGIGLETVSLERGQLVVSVRFLAVRWRWSKSRVARFIAALENRHMIRSVSGTPAGTVYAIAHYDTYNPVEDTKRDSNGDRTGYTSGTAAGQERDKGKNKKNIENKKNREGARKRAHALPEDWKPNEQHAAYARKHRLNLEDEADSFRDHAEAKGRLLVSWDAGFRSWLKKAREFAAEKRGHRNVSAGSQAAAILSAPSDDVGKRRAEREREAEQQRIDAAVTRWEADHPAEAAALRTECGVDTAGLFEKGAARAAYKGRVLEQMDGAA